MVIGSSHPAALLLETGKVDGRTWNLGRFPRKLNSSPSVGWGEKFKPFFCNKLLAKKQTNK